MQWTRNLLSNEGMCVVTQAYVQGVVHRLGAMCSECVDFKFDHSRAMPYVHLKPSNYLSNSSDFRAAN